MRIDEDKAVIIAIFTAMLFSTLIIVVTRAYGKSPEINYKEMDHQRLVSEIMFLESSYRHDNLWGDNGTSYGIAQFKVSTFDWLKHKAGMPWLEHKEMSDQIILLDWAVRNGYGRKHWSVYNKAEQRAIIGKYIKLK